MCPRFDALHRGLIAIYIPFASFVRGKKRLLDFSGGVKADAVGSRE